MLRKREIFLGRDMEEEKAAIKKKKHRWLAALLEVQILRREADGGY